MSGLARSRAVITVMGLVGTAADERAYAKEIRDWLELTGGRPATARRVTARESPARTRRATKASDEVTPATWDDLAQ